MLHFSGQTATQGQIHESTSALVCWLIDAARMSHVQWCHLELLVRVFVDLSRWKLLKVTVVSSFRGNSPSQAEISFLNKCKWLELYGVDMHFVKVRALFLKKNKKKSEVSAC